MGISDSTKRNYRRVFLLLRRGFEQGAACGDFCPERYSRWLVAEKSGLASNTWRQYRAASLYCIHADYPAAYQACESLLTAVSQSNKATGAIRGKRKGYTDEELQLLLDYCLRCSLPTRHTARGAAHFWWRNVYLTLRAGDMVGLRPSEWLGAHLSEANGSPVLTVQNAKNTHGRAHGKTRTLDLGKMLESDLAVVREKIAMTQQAIASGRCKDIEDYQRIARRYLLRANNALFPGQSKTIAFYSTRHQVVTDLKTAGTSTEEMAALLGHSSTETASIHYGRKSRRSRKSPTSVQADKTDVARVAALNQHRGVSVKVGNVLGITPKQPVVSPKPQ